jgi:hypothetical protein
LRAKEMHFRARQAITGQPNIRHSLRSGLRLIRALLGVPCSLAAVALQYVSQHLIPASGDRNHTISLVRFGAARLAALSASTATRPTFRDDRPERPSQWGGMAGVKHDFPKNGRKIFLREGLDETSDNTKVICPSGRGPAR